MVPQEIEKVIRREASKAFAGMASDLGKCCVEDTVEHVMLDMLENIHNRVVHSKNVDVEELVLLNEVKHMLVHDRNRVLNIVLNEIGKYV